MVLGFQHPVNHTGPPQDEGETETMRETETDSKQGRRVFTDLRHNTQVNVLLVCARVVGNGHLRITAGGMSTLSQGNTRTIKPPPTTTVTVKYKP